METAGNLNSYLQTLKKCGKIQMTNANKLKIEKRNIFWATEKYRRYLLKLSDLYRSLSNSKSNWTYGLCYNPTRTALPEKNKISNSFRKKALSND